MADHVLVPDNVDWHIFGSYVTCSGTVKAPHGAAIQRKVVVYFDNNPYEVVGISESSPITGEFSITLDGHAGQEFTVIAKGEYGENDEIVSNCNLNGTGPTGLYIAPALNNIQFFVGPGDVTSPFVDILIPTPVVESVGQVDIISWGDAQLALSVDAVGSVSIISYGDVTFPFAETYGTGSAILESLGNISLPSFSVESEASTDLYSWGLVSVHRPVIDGKTADEGASVFPELTVSASVSNPIIVDGFVSIKVPAISSVSTNSWVAYGNTSIPMAESSGYVIVSESAYGSVEIVVPSVSSAAILEAIANGSVEFPVLAVDGLCQLSHSFDPLSFEPDCGLVPPISYGAVAFPVLVTSAVS